MIRKPPNEVGRRRGSNGGGGGGGFRGNAKPGSEKAKLVRPRSAGSPKHQQKGQKPVKPTKALKGKANLPDEPTSPTLARYMKSRLAKEPAQPEDLQQLTISQKDHQFHPPTCQPVAPSLGGGSTCSGCKHGCTSPLHIPAQETAHEVHACIVNLLVQFRHDQWGFDQTPPVLPPSSPSTAPSTPSAREDLRSPASTQKEKVARCRPEIQSLRKDWELYQQAMIRSDLKLTRRDRAMILERQLDTIDLLLRDCRRRKLGNRGKDALKGDAPPNQRNLADTTGKNDNNDLRNNNRIVAPQSRFAEERSDSTKSPRSLIDHLSELETPPSSSQYASATSSNMSATTTESSYYSSSIYSSESSYISNTSNSLRAPSLASGDSSANSFVAPPSLAPSHISGGALLGGEKEEVELDDAFLFLSPGDVDRLLVQSSEPFP